MRKCYCRFQCKKKGLLKGHALFDRLHGWANTTGDVDESTGSNSKAEVAQFERKRLDSYYRPESK